MSAIFLHTSLCTPNRAITNFMKSCRCDGFYSSAALFQKLQFCSHKKRPQEYNRGCAQGTSCLSKLSGHRKSFLKFIVSLAECSVVLLFVPHVKVLTSYARRKYGCLRLHRVPASVPKIITCGKSIDSQITV